MRYLIFDIECCDGKHICEFGYVIANEQFEIIEKKVLLINPDKPFDLTNREGQKDLTLFFSEEEYYAAPLFPVYYDEIRRILEAPDQIVIGHSVANDAIFLRTACKRYKKRPINFNFVDSQKLYSEFSGDKARVSLETTEELLNLGKPQFLHKSDDDALLTMQLIAKICSVLEMTLQELMNLCPAVCGSSHNFNIMYAGNSLPEMLAALDKDANSLSNKQKSKCLAEFAKLVQPNGEVVESKLTNTKLCFSTRFEKEHTKETLKLAQLLANHGCRYNGKVSENDYYVISSDELTNPQIKEDSRYEIATRGDEGVNVTVMTLEELLAILKVSPEQLAEMEMPTVAEKSKKKARHDGNFRVGNFTNTLGDVLKAKGIDLTKAIS